MVLVIRCKEETDSPLCEGEDNFLTVTVTLTVLDRDGCWYRFSRE